MIYRFKVKAINSVGASNFSDLVQITTATLCVVSHDPAFVLPPINYKIGADAIPFTIPNYTTTGCPEGEILDLYECRCYRISDDYEWIQTQNAIISSSGGSIH